MKFIIKEIFSFFILINLLLNFPFVTSLNVNLMSLYGKKLLKNLKTYKNSIVNSKNVVFNSKTNPNDWGNNSIFYLDRHNVDCGPRRIIQGFRLFRPKDNQLAYEYACLNSSSVLTPYYTDQTPWNETSNNERGSANYLDRHNVKCKNGYALQQFKLIRNGKKIAYAYRCAQIKSKNCTTQKTQETWGNNVYETIYLDRQRLDVGKGKALTQFKLLSRYANGGVFYQYLYSSCELNTSIKPKNIIKNSKQKKSLNKDVFNKINTQKRKSDKNIFNQQTPSNDWGNGSIFYLDRHDVKCGNRQVIQSFHLTRPKQNQLSYEYSCINIKKTKNVVAYTQKTKFDETANNQRSSTNYLDRHNVICKQNHAIQQFKLIRNGNKIAYSYKCLPVEVCDCKSETTQETFGNKFYENIYLDRQRIVLGEGRVLNQFKLNSRYQGNSVFYKYSYTSCLLIEYRNKLNKSSIDDNNIKKGKIDNRNSNNSKSNISSNNKTTSKKKKNSVDLSMNNIKNINQDQKKPSKFNNNKKKAITPKSNLNAPINNKGNNSFKFDSSATLDKKINIKKGIEFCRDNCLPNESAKIKLCFDRGFKNCKPCIYKNRINIHNNRDSNELCTKACNAISGNTQCEFYPLFNNKKKEINSILLKKFSLSMDNIQKENRMN